jgi:hypothetical protein
MGSGRSGFHTGIGVDTRCCTAQWRRPATALPCVPSTCSSSSSRRLTLTAQDEFTEANAPLPNSTTAYAASSAVASYGRPDSSHRRGMCVAVRTYSAVIGPNRSLSRYCQCGNMSRTIPPPSAAR